MDYKKLADLLYPNIDKDINYYFDKYKKRNLKEGAIVTRFAPSPTGYLHIGGVFQSVLHTLLAGEDGVFYFRLEDTDQKREIPEAGEILFRGLEKFGLTPTEGYRGDNLEELGNYGPYIQSNRAEIYQTFAKHLVSIGRAFPCFCEKTEGKEDVLEKREQQLQESNNLEQHDKCRELTYEEIENNIKAGKPFALRLLSKGDPNKTFKIVDVIKGEKELRENGKDVIIMKSNGIPPYNFAHVVDDTLMGTTMVVRGEDWFQSVASHIEIFDAFGFNRIPYAHTPNICKTDNGNKRKLSKRKDPEADSRKFFEWGYPVDAIKEYLINLINSNFEEWRLANPTLSYKEFKFSKEKIGSNNPMFDMDKINDISKSYISRLTAEEVYNSVLEWAKEYDADFATVLESNKDFAVATFDIDRGGEKPRKDIYRYDMVRDYYNYMFNPYETVEVSFGETKADNATLCNILNKYAQDFNANLEKDEWFNAVKTMAEEFNYCTNNKEYKANPDNYLGNTAEFCNVLRLGITGKANTPDLYSICKVLGKEELLRRVEILKGKLL
ncbi:MAG: glutamate--tRNA ligase [Clostridia bacterium]|nr:glutamate--tRNA ligase [Clostridia bacterium]